LRLNPLIVNHIVGDVIPLTLAWFIRHLESIMLQSESTIVDIWAASGLNRWLVETLMSALGLQTERGVPIVEVVGSQVPFTLIIQFSSEPGISLGMILIGIGIR
jgi:hypothetical protein